MQVYLITLDHQAYVSSYILFQQEYPQMPVRLLKLRYVWRHAECRTGCCNLGNEVFKGSCSSFVSSCLPCAFSALFSYV